MLVGTETFCPCTLSGSSTSQWGCHPKAPQTACGLVAGWGLDNRLLSSQLRLRRLGVQIAPEAWLLGLQAAGLSLCLHDSPSARCVPVSPSCKDMVTLYEDDPSDITLISSPPQGPYLQIQSRSEVLQVRTTTDKLGGGAHSAHSTGVQINVPRPVLYFSCCHGRDQNIRTRLILTQRCWMESTRMPA